MSNTVLVTGGSGSIANWAIVELLKKGYNVRTTVRSLDKEPAVRAQIASAVEPGDPLSFFAADLMKDEGWDAAVAGCQYVLHIAAPVGVDAPRDAKVLIVPTRDGALRVLRAACGAKVERVVLTSAIEACRPPMMAPDSVSDERVWTDTNDPDIGPYRLAKTLAEQAAWDFMKTQTGATTLTTILPSAVVGPALSKHNLQSVHLVQHMLSGGLPRLPRIGFCVVDIRDVIDLHLRAMTTPAAAGQRFIAAGDWMWMSEVAGYLRSALGDRAKKAPTKIMPDFVLRIVALFNRQMKFALPLVGRKHVFSSAKAEAMLGWKPRPARTAILDSANSAIAVGAV